MTPLMGFSPDSDPMTSGVMLECENIIPHESGFKGAPSAISTGVPSLPSACQGASVAVKLDSNRRLFAGTATAIYELIGNAWVNQSGSVYSGGTESRWCISQFGNATLAANGTNTIQRSNTSGVFASIATAPKARIIFSVGAFVMALNVDDGTSKPDGWANCASFDDMDWTPSTTTLANSGRLVSSPGEITAGGRLGEYAIAYKERSIYVGQFVGAPATFDWIQVPGGSAGCVGQDAWCDIRDAHFMVGPDNFWIFDGTRPQAVGDGQIRQWFYNNSNPLYRYKTQCVFDRQNNLVYIHYCSKTAITLDSALVYHVLSKQWGKVSVGIQTLLNYVAPSATYDTWGNYGATYETLPSVSYDSQYWLAGGRVMSIFDSTNTLKVLSGTSGTGKFSTGDLGDDDQVTSLTKLRIRFQQSPSSASVETLGKMNEGDMFASKPASPMTNQQFDVRQSARFHRANFTLVGDCKFNAIRATITESGTR